MMALPYRRGGLAGMLALLLMLVVPVMPDYDVRAATDLVIGADAEVANAQGDNVNLREQPSLTGAVLTNVAEGDLVMVVDGPFTDDTDGTVWYLVIGNDQTGYVLADYLRTPLDERVSAAAVMTTTTRVNLRAGPGTDYTVLLVIPSGATVSTTGEVQNGYSRLTYDGVTGWSASQYLEGSAALGTAVVSANLNLRSGPGTTYPVLLVIPNGSTVTITSAEQNGFYGVEYAGVRGYASSNYLQLDISQTATVVGGGLNLRTGPGTTYPVLLVMPDGATVTITGALQTGYYPVVYNGTAGYASADYLQIGSAPPPPPVSTPGWTTANLNLRSGPSTTTTVLALMPTGSQLTITGAETSGFYPVTFGSISGYASSRYITTTAPGPTPTPTPLPTAATFGATTTTNLRLRTGAGTSSDIILVIPNGSRVRVLGSQTNGFYPVSYDNATGYASASYITIDPPSLIAWPVTGGTWHVLQGYNGSSHQNNSSAWQYLYSLDVARQDGPTAGANVYAPVAGTVAWYERATGGITINMGNGYAFAMFHVTVDRKWNPGDTIQQGAFIGTVSPEGGEGFQQVPHIHLTLWQTNDGGNWDRHAAPFTGQFTISGVDLPANGTAYQWSGLLFYP